MGQSASGNNGTKGKELIKNIAERCYQTHFAEKKDYTAADFFRAVCETVEEINKKLGSTQINVPKATTLKLAYKKLQAEKEKLTKEFEENPEKAKLTKEEFQEILEEVIVESGISAGIGLKDILAYIFGIPVTALMVKQRFGPHAIPNDLFIPAVTSATVFLLAKLRKI